MSDQPLGPTTPTEAALPQDTSVSDSSQQQQPTGENPAWGEVLGILPTEFHSQIKPHLDKWEKGVSDRFAQVQSKYAPYQDFIGVPPEQIQASMQLAQMVAQDPRAFYDRMTEHYGQEWGLTNGQGQDAPNDADDYSLDGLDDEGQDLSNNPLIQQLKEQQDTIANFLATQMQQQEQQQYEQQVAQESQRIDQTMSKIAQDNGMQELPPQAAKMIISLALQNNVDLEAAAQEVMPLFASQQSKPSPTILTPGGGVPNSNLDPAKLSGSDTRSMVVQMLAQQAAARN